MKHYITISIIIFLLLSLFIGCKKHETESTPASNIVDAKKGFSISPDNQVYFATGNLQYQASTKIWRFAENQWETIGSDNSNISEYYDGWIDLFGWGTSGNNHGAICYQPWSISFQDTVYYVYSDKTYNLYDLTGEADWGHNTINNANHDYYWRTLTKDEWRHLLYTRNTPSNIRYAKATVNGVNGLILLPDNWERSNYTLNNINIHNAQFSSNTISKTDWITVFETKDAVFLPVTGCRTDTLIHYIDNHGYYWSSSTSTDMFSNAYYVFFNDDLLYGDCNFSFYNMPIFYRRGLGQSVRLVRPVD